MSRQVLFEDGNVIQSGNGMRGIRQKNKIKNEKNQEVEKSYKEATICEQDSQGVSCDIPSGAIRVAQLMYGSKDTEEKAETNQEEQEEENSGDSSKISTDSIEYMERLLEDMKASRTGTSSKSSNAKKNLNYSYRRVSGAILRAKNRIQAGNALSIAKSSLSNLQKKSASSQYNSNELEIAIIHAKKMVRTAQKKVQNIKLEDNHKKQDDKTENHQERKNNVLHGLVTDNKAAENIKREKELLLLTKKLKQKREQKKNSHRRDESNELIEADMEYLRKKIDMMRQEILSSAAAQDSVTVEATAVTEGTAETSTETSQGTSETTTTGSVDSASSGTNTGSSGFSAMV